MSGRFVFEAHSDFKNAYMDLLNDASIHEIELEMSKVNCVDFAGLGMLMLLNERATVANKSVILLNVYSDIYDILEVANFSKIFTIKNES
jgi:anti-anti-sigma regulatory factor